MVVDTFNLIILMLLEILIMMVLQLHLNDLEIMIIFLFHLIFIYMEVGMVILMDLKMMINLINGLLNLNQIWNYVKDPS